RGGGGGGGGGDQRVGRGGVAGGVEPVGVQRLDRPPVEPERGCSLPRVADRVALLVDELGIELDVPVGGGGAGDGLDLGEERCGNSPALPAGGTAEAGRQRPRTPDVGVRALVDVPAQIFERPRAPVREA